MEDPDDKLAISVAVLALTVYESKDLDMLRITVKKAARLLGINPLDIAFYLTMLSDPRIDEKFITSLVNSVPIELHMVVCEAKLRAFAEMFGYKFKLR